MKTEKKIAMKKATKFIVYLMILWGCSINDRIEEDEVSKQKFVSLFRQNRAVEPDLFEGLTFEYLFIFKPYYPKDLIEDEVETSILGIPLEKHNSSEDQSLVLFKSKEGMLSYFYVPITEIDFSELTRRKFNQNELFFEVEESSISNRKLKVKEVKM